MAARMVRRTVVEMAVLMETQLADWLDGPTVDLWGRSKVDSLADKMAV